MIGVIFRRHMHESISTDALFNAFDKRPQRTTSNTCFQTAYEMNMPSETASIKLSLTVADERQLQYKHVRFVATNQHFGGSAVKIFRHARDGDALLQTWTEYAAGGCALAFNYQQVDMRAQHAALPSNRPTCLTANAFLVQCQQGGIADKISGFRLSNQRSNPYLLRAGWCRRPYRCRRGSRKLPCAECRARRGRRAVRRLVAGL